MAILQSFVAAALLQRVRQVSSDLTAPATAAFRGAAAFVDISGYTTLAESLCGQGPAGVEQLGAILDLAFRRCLHSVDVTGGEIACFAGDGFIAYWPADHSDIRRALQRAHRCARLLHNAQTDVADAPAVPRLHIGISAGDMWTARLGGDERWQLLLAGQAVRAACAAAARAAAGETVVDPEAGLFAASFPLTTPDEDLEIATPAPSHLSIADVVAHAPTGVQEYFDAGYEAWIPQRRTIYALFVRVDALRDPDQDPLATYQAIVGAIHDAIRGHTGSTGTFLLDDKGLVFTLTLGMPHDVHEDDALRTVRAGLAIQTSLEGCGLQCAIGVASGTGVCMPLGGPPRRHYWSVGRFMHVAGRLMQAAGRGMLCTDEIAAQVRHLVTLAPERPLLLKGLQWPLRPFRITEAAAHEERSEVLFGREAEQTSLEQHLAAYERGRGGVLWIVGKAGIGKTALMQAFRQEAARREPKTFRGGADSMAAKVPYAVWRPVVSSLLGRSSSPRTELQADLSAIEHTQLVPLINAVMPGLFEETPTVRNLTGQARADATTRVLSEVILARTGGRFVLLLEDCHWMDSASWRLVLRIAQDHPHAFIALTSRPELDNQELSTLRRLEHFSTIGLSELRPEAIQSLAATVLGGAADPDLLADISRRAGGNPLFAREYALLHLQSQRRDTAGEAPSPSPVSDRDAMSAAMRGVIMSRLDGLSPPEAVALQVASVIGDSFSMSLLTQLYPENVHDLPQAIARLTDRQLIIRDDVDGAQMTFQHAHIRHVTYGRLTEENRRDFHRALAMTIERDHHQDLRPHYATLAHHWANAMVDAPTLTFADHAGAQALAAGAFAEADRLFTTCVELADRHAVPTTTADRIRWHRQIADARHGMGQLEPRSSAAHLALRLAGRVRPSTAAGLVVQAGLRACVIGLRRTLLRRRAVADEARVMEIARAYRHSAEVCYFNNDMIGMICDSVGAVAYSSRLKPSAVLVGASTELGGVLSVAGFRRIGERILTGAIVMAEDEGDLAAQAYGHMISCLYSVGIGDWTAAEASARRCQALCEPMDDRVNWTNAQAVRFWMSLYRSEHAAALDAACHLRDRADETGNRQHQAWALRFLAILALRREAPAEAVTHTRTALNRLVDTAARNERIPTLGIHALALWQTGDVWAARATAREAVAQVTHVARPIGHATLEGYSSLIAVALDAWREERSPEWKHAVKECLRILSGYQAHFVVGRPRYELHRGDYYRLAGFARLARRCYAKGAQVAGELGMPWDAQRCREAMIALPRAASRSH